MEVPTLTRFSFLTIIDCIVNEESPCITVEMQWLKLVRLLDQGSWGEESKCLLNRVVKFYRHKVTPRILEALLPLNAKELDLKECPLVTEKCINLILNRCQHLRLLDLTNNSHFVFNKIHIFSFNHSVICKELTIVILEDCPQVNDVNIQTLLKNAPLLMSLNIARCNISDNVFLLNDVEQRKKEICCEFVHRYDCKLRTVDVSRCKNFSNTGVRYLCTLCGPTLQTINLSWTKVDCTSLLYLSGYGLLASLQFFASFGFISHPLTIRLFSALQDFDQLSQELKNEWSSQLQKCCRLNQQMKRLGLEEVPLTCLDVNQSTDKCELVNLTDKTSSSPCNIPHNENSSENTSVQGSIDSTLENSSVSNICLQPVCCGETHVLTNQSSSTCASTLSAGAKESEILATTTETLSPEPELVRTLVSHTVTAGQLTGQNNTKSQDADKTRTEASSSSRSDPEINGASTLNHDLAASTLIAAPYFKSDISSLSLNGSIFNVESLSLECFKQFLKTNTNVLSLRLYGGSFENYVSDSVLEIVGEHAQSLTSLSLEGCDRITNYGVTRLVNCKQLHNIDFTGLHKIEDSAIIDLIQNLNLTHLQLAETRVTSASLNALASRDTPDLLKELDVSWCDEMEDSKGLDNVVQTCTSLCRLMLRECCHFSTTINLLAANCHNITEISVASNMAVIMDESVIVLSKNLPLLEKIDLGWNTNLTNQSIQALLTNCRRLTSAILEGLKITSAPFLQIITLSAELKKYLADAVNKKILAHKVGVNDFLIKLSELPCLPHRSMTYCTELRNLSLNYCDFVEDGDLQQIVSVAHGSLKIIDYYGEEVEESVSSLESLIEAQVTLILEELQGIPS